MKNKIVRSIFSITMITTLTACGASPTLPEAPSDPTTGSSVNESVDLDDSEEKDDLEDIEEKDSSGEDEIDVQELSDQIEAAIAKREAEYKEQRADDGYYDYGLTINSLDGAKASNSSSPFGGLFSGFFGESADTGAVMDYAAETVESAAAGDFFYMPYEEDFNTAEFSPIKESGFVRTATSPLSTFAADVDTASYSELRLDTITSSNSGQEMIEWFDDSAIRIEEMINYFDYDYPDAKDGEMFSVTTEVAPCPWNDETMLLMVGVKAKEVQNVSGSNLVLLIDTSGSMFGPTRLGFVQEAMKMIVDKMGPNDKISIVTYAGTSETLAKGYGQNKKEKLIEIIDGLNAYGSTNGGQGIVDAYDLAQKYFIKDGVNRVILCTDGDLNVGVTSEAALTELITKEKETGVFLSVLGVGNTNYSDSRMEALADNGNGNYAYIDCLDEAKRVLKKEYESTTVTVAKDVKFQLDFNPEMITAYRQIGYEDRAMADADFADDSKDGGEVGSGQTVTVLYEIVPYGSSFSIPEVSSKYQNTDEREEKIEKKSSPDAELLTVNIRYKEADKDQSELKDYVVYEKDIKEDMDSDLSWAAGVAQAGMLLRDSSYAGTSTFSDVKSRLKKIPDVIDDDLKIEFLLLLTKFAGEPIYSE